MPGPWKDARGIIVTTTPTIEGVRSRIIWVSLPAR